ncbi:hypothetical protein [Agitococcus lubricus]|uniref:Lipoprotein n=1 Tax=Agitococcus lubricus TaxID=1077255 RepID=A0A2T5IWD1_9GAMM|nr:hypothetical protein [Agitococcus lubricus]PTQ88190.1 hypothetical protein C8N29_11450 [Agitococcus lubricus]
MKSVYIILSIGLLGCQTPVTLYKPALLDLGNNNHCYNELYSAIAQKLGAPVSISPTVFHDNSRLYLEKQRISANPLTADTASVAKPLLLELQIANQQCRLVSQIVGLNQVLKHCLCKMNE